MNRADVRTHVRTNMQGHRARIKEKEKDPRVHTHIRSPNYLRADTWKHHNIRTNKARQPRSFVETVVTVVTKKAGALTGRKSNEM